MTVRCGASEMKPPRLPEGLALRSPWHPDHHPVKWFLDKFSTNLGNLSFVVPWYLHSFAPFYNPQSRIKDKRDDLKQFHSFVGKSTAAALLTETVNDRKLEAQSLLGNLEHAQELFKISSWTYSPAEYRKVQRRCCYRDNAGSAEMGENDVILRF